MYKYGKNLWLFDVYVDQWLRGQLFFLKLFIARFLPDFIKRIQYGVYKDATLQGPSGCLLHMNMCYTDMSTFLIDGWEIFVSNHCIKVGDIILLKHGNDAKFLVPVFGSSGCEKQRTIYFQNYSFYCLGEWNLNLSTIWNKKKGEHRGPFHLKNTPHIASKKET